MKFENSLNLNRIKEAVLLEGKTADLMSAVAPLIKSVKSFELMRDNDFSKRKDREINDIHLFFELENGKYFHLRAYTRYMLDTGVKDKVFLTGYIKSSVNQVGGEHSLRQGWYEWNPTEIANEVMLQNPTLF